MDVLIIGSAECVRDDLSKIDRNYFDVVIGVNAAAIEFGPVDYHVSLHPEEYKGTVDAPLVSHRKVRGVDIALGSSLWDREGGNSGSSGLFAVKFALEHLNADRIVLAGIPMTDTPHFNRRKDWAAAPNFRQTWEKHLPRLVGRVTSLSGWTAELLNGEQSPSSPDYSG